MTADGLALSAGEHTALLEALEDEYRAWATYDGVIRDFGAVRPFSNIKEAEARHILALHDVFQRYGLTPPPNDWPGRVQHFASVSAACAAAVEGETENQRMYQRLMQATTRPDILRVFANLRDASAHRHLPAFQRCAAGGRGMGHGWGRRGQVFSPERSTL